MNKNPFICLNCSNNQMTETNNKIVCNNCNTSYPITNTVYDFLYNPTKDVIKEITGMAIENGYEAKDYLNFKVKLVDNAKKLDEKLNNTKNDYNQYYQQTLINFNQAFESIQNRFDFNGAQVLEIGACYDYYFLEPFKKLNAQCFGVNLHFNLTEEKEYQNFPIKVLADMNRLPFQDSFFDVIIISATSHHSNTPEKLISEIARVLRPGGACLMINDPIMGLFKSYGSKMVQSRHDHINENEYTISRYNRLFRANHLVSEHLFSRYHDQKLLEVKIHPDVRFAYLAQIVAKLWKIDFLRNALRKYFLYFAQSIFGFPMNVVLIKKL